MCGVSPRITEKDERRRVRKVKVRKVHAPPAAYAECLECPFAVDITDKATWVYQPAPRNPKPIIGCKLKGFVFYADRTVKDRCEWLPRTPTEWKMLAVVRPDLGLPSPSLDDPEIRQRLLILRDRYEKDWENTGTVEI